MKGQDHQPQLVIAITTSISIEIIRSRITQTQEQYTQVHIILFHPNRVKPLILYLLIISIIDKALLSNSHITIISNNLYNLITTTLIINSLSIMPLISILIYNLFRTLFNLAAISQVKILKLLNKQILLYKR